MIEKLAHFDQPNCYRICNDLIDLIVSTDVGPRILRYGFLDRENILGEHPELSTPTPWGDWKPWGGHRLWVAPEDMPISYAPDDSPLHSEIRGDYRICLTQPVDRAGFEKQMIVELMPDLPGAIVHHRITNRNSSNVRIAPWALTILRGGGTTLIPQEPFRSHDEHVQPARPLVLWHFTDLTDPRLTLGRKFLRLRSEASMQDPQKFGVTNQQGWCAYYHPAMQTLFLKSVSYDPQATYPDFGSNTETYTAGHFIELETLGPLVNLAPNESTTHVEHWQLFHNVDLGQSDDEVEATIKPLAEEFAKLQCERVGSG